MEGHDADLILLAGVLLAAGICAALVADRIRIPGLLLFLGLGMLAGSDGVGGIDFSDAELTRTLGTIGLVLIIFEGGLNAGWREIRPVLGTAISLAFVGTILTAVLAGIAAKVIFGLGTLQAMLVGSAMAATDSAAIFAVLRESRLERPLARSLEGESGMNDPVALLLVIGFIDWIQDPGYGALDMAGSLALRLVAGIAVGLILGRLAADLLRRIDLPTEGVFPVLSVAVAGIAYGTAELAHGSGLLAVYLTALSLGDVQLPARRTIVAFHQGLSWVAQITLFFVLGLLVLPSQLGDVAVDGLLLSAVLIFVARPLAAFVASLPSPFNNRERLMLGWAGLRGAAPIWLATFPVVAGVASSERLFDIVFFVVVTSALVQGATFEPLARRLGLTTEEPALPQRLLESSRIQRLGGDVVAHRIEEDAAADGHLVRELGLPREALVSVIAREGEAIPPRGSTQLRAGDELHILARSGALEEVERLTKQWHDGPIGGEKPPRLPHRGSPLIFSVRPLPEGLSPSAPEEINGVPVTGLIRVRHDRPGCLATLADGRYAVTSPELVAVGGHRALAAFCERRGSRRELEPSRRAWWQEVAGALRAPG